MGDNDKNKSTNTLTSKKLNMKRIHLLLIIAVAIVSSSCSTTELVIMSSTLDNAIDEINQDLENLGYHLTNSSEEGRNQLVVLGTSYSSSNGFGTALGNDIWRNIEYLLSEENCTFAVLL
jgi:Ulp1 family protease